MATRSRSRTGTGNSESDDTDMDAMTQTRSSEPEVATMTEEEMDMWDSLLDSRAGISSAIPGEGAEASPTSGGRQDRSGSILALRSDAEQRRVEKAERERQRLVRAERRATRGEEDVMKEWELDFEMIRDYHTTSRSRREILVDLPPEMAKVNEDKAPEEKAAFSWEDSQKNYREGLANRRQNGWKPALFILPIPEVEGEQDFETTESKEVEDRDGRGWAAFVHLHGEGAAKLQEEAEDGEYDSSMWEVAETGSTPSQPTKRVSHSSPSSGKASMGRVALTQKELAVEEFRKELAEASKGFETMAARGSNFIKYNRYNVSAKRLVRCSTNGTVDWGSGSLHLRDAIKVSEPSYKVVREKFGASPPQLCILIRMPNRDLCLRARSEQERDLWLQGLIKLKTQIDHSEEMDEEKHVVPTNIYQSNADVLDFKKVAFSGRTFIKHSRRGAPHPRLVRVNLNSGAVDWSSGSLSLKDASEIAVGKTTKNLKVLSDKAVPPELCFSIVLPTRTLDLQATTQQERDVWVEGMRSLIERLQQRDESKVHALDWGVLASTGHMFVKHGRKGKPHPRVVKVELDTGVVSWGLNLQNMDPNHSINLKDTQEIVAGCAKGVFARPGYNKGLDERLCFSLLLPARSLDLQAESPAERNFWIENFFALREELLQQAGQQLMLQKMRASLNVPHDKTSPKPKQLVSGQKLPKSFEDLPEVDDEKYDSVLNTPRSSANFFSATQTQQRRTRPSAFMIAQELLVEGEAMESGGSERSKGPNNKIDRNLLGLQVDWVEHEEQEDKPGGHARHITLQEEVILAGRIEEQDTLLKAMGERLAALRDEKSALRVEVAELEAGVAVDLTPETPALGVYLTRNQRAMDSDSDDHSDEESDEESGDEEPEEESRTADAAANTSTDIA
eukprot:gb/GEZN01001656.1/.p1 GENE.gb/GEZN01001656.1/~~gb/GEZN01001656.1/.p1  ORF type:complete len:904 (+),score=189.32 gb/GEZN01001656.1/:124-2835(+)